MSLQKIPEETRHSERIFRLISYGLVALMLACAALTVVSVTGYLFTGWTPNSLPVLCFLVALERLYTYGRFKKLTFMNLDWIKAFGAQWILIAVVVKVTVGLSHGFGAFLSEIPHWSSSFLTTFLSFDFLYILTIVLVAWFLSGDFAALIDEMGIAHVSVLQNASPESLPASTPSARQRLLGLTLGVGIALLLLTTLTRMDLQTGFTLNKQPFYRQLPALASGGASTLLYFILGLGLISQTRFMELHTRWSLQRIPVSQEMAKRWDFYSVAFLAIVILLVSLLPTHYSLGLVSLLGGLLILISRVILFLFEIILFLLLFLISLPSLLTGKGTLPVLPTAQPTPSPLPQDALNHAAPTTTLMELAHSVFFWAVFLGVLAFALIQFLRTHEEVREKLRTLRGWILLAQVWQWLTRRFGNVTQEISRAVERGMVRLRTRGGTQGNALPSGFINLRGLDARRQVYFFYLTLVRRSEEGGFPRRRSQTPYEYAASLERKLPEVDKEIDALTAAFVEARYSQRPVASDEARRVKAAWGRIRKALQQRRKS